MDTVPEPKRLKIPAARDIRGHEMEEEMFLLASLEGLPLNSEYIGPDTPISRGDFSKAIVKSMDIPLIEREEPKRTRGRKNQSQFPKYLKM